MLLRQIRLATFKSTTLANLQTYVNDFTRGKAVSQPNSGTVAYAAGEVAQRVALGQSDVLHDGTNYYVALWYAEE